MDRRKALTSIVAVFSGIAAIGFSIPFFKFLFPGFRNEVVLDIDIADMEPGEFKRIRWLGRHVYLIRRNQGTVRTLSELGDSREDPESERSRQPSYASNTQRSIKPEHLLVYANCTHLGCEVEVKTGENFEGFRCPCHRSEFDSAGRVEKGAAAKLNLEVPEYGYVAKDVIRLKQV